MTAFTDQPQAAAALGDPTTSPLDLMAIAQKYPALWGQIARHPNTYPDLLAWLNQVGDASVRQAVAERTAPATPEPIPDEPIPDEPVAPDEPVVTPDEDVPDDAQAPAHAAADADVRAPDAETDPVPDDSDAEPSTPRRGDTEPEPEPEPEPTVAPTWAPPEAAQMAPYAQPAPDVSDDDPSRIDIRSMPHPSGDQQLFAWDMPESEPTPTLRRSPVLGIVLIAAAVVVFAVCAFVQHTGGAVMFSRAYTPSSPFWAGSSGRAILDATWLPGWIVSIGCLVGGIAALARRVARA